MPSRIAFEEPITPAPFQSCLGKKGLHVQSLSLQFPSNSPCIILCLWFNFIITARYIVVSKSWPVVYAFLNRIHISTSPFPESLQYCFASLQPGQLLHPGAQKVHIKGYIKGDNIKSSSLSPGSLRYYLSSTFCTIN